MNEISKITINGISYNIVDTITSINGKTGVISGSDINAVLSADGYSKSVSAISVNTSSSCSITGSGNTGKSQTIIYTNSGSSDLTVTVPTTYQTPNGQAIELTCPAGGYCEVNYININGTIYARGI